MMDLELLTVEEVMKLLRTSRDTVYRLAAEGELPCRKIGRTWRFPRDELESYIRERSQADSPGKLGNKQLGPQED